MSAETIRPVVDGDAEAICAIYNPYILGTTVTFEEETVSPAEIVDRISEVRKSLPWLVAEEAGQVIGYAYATPWKGRCSYRFSVETTIYLKGDVAGRGLGARLYSSLVAELRGLRLHAAIGGIALPNAASVAVHEKLGFRKVAHFEQVGWKFGKWIDVGYWELLL